MVVVVVGAEFWARQIGWVGVKSEHPIAVSEFWHERFEEIIGAIRNTFCGSEIVVKRDEYFGVFLFFFDVIVGGIVAIGIDARPRIEIAIRVGAADIKPHIGIDFVVNDEIGDAPVALFAVEEIRHEAGKSAIIAGFPIDGGTEHRGLYNSFLRIDAVASSPIGDAVDDGGHDDAVICVFADGVDNGLVFIEAIAVVLDLVCATRLRLLRLPFGPDEVHGDAVDFVSDDLCAILEIGLQALDALSHGICIADARRFIDADVVFAILRARARSTLDSFSAAVAYRSAFFTLFGTSLWFAFGIGADVVFAFFCPRAGATVELSAATVVDGAAVFALCRASRGAARGIDADVARARFRSRARAAVDGVSAAIVDSAAVFALSLARARLARHGFFDARIGFAYFPAWARAAIERSLATVVDSAAIGFGGFARRRRANVDGDADVIGTSLCRVGAFATGDLISATVVDETAVFVFVFARPWRACFDALIRSADLAIGARSAIECIAASVVDGSTLGTLGFACLWRAFVGACAVLAEGGIALAGVIARSAVFDGVERRTSVAAARFIGAAKRRTAFDDAIAVFVANFAIATLASGLDIAFSVDASDAIGAGDATCTAVFRIGEHIDTRLATTPTIGIACGRARLRTWRFARSAIADFVIAALIPTFSAVIGVAIGIDTSPGATHHCRSAFGHAFIAFVGDDRRVVASICHHRARDCQRAPI